MYVWSLMRTGGPASPSSDEHHCAVSAVGLPKQGGTTSSYWLQDGANPLAKQGAADNFNHQKVDVVIIGSGITGISAAYHLVQGLKTDNLSRAGDFRIVVLEARDFCKSDRGPRCRPTDFPLGSGATGRNGGHFITRQLPFSNCTFFAQCSAVGGRWR